jgi:zinc/manganese transport system ATP-binding protein
MTVVALSGVALALGGRTILADVNLAIPAGQFIGVLGVNGSGKSTLMRAMLGLIPPFTGSITVFGAPAAPGNPAIGYMPQTRTPPPGRLCGRDFLMAAASGTGWGLPLPGADERADVARVLGLVAATHLANRPLRELSGGERQRLLLAQALLGKPRLLLLDEPLMSLDPHHQRGVVDLVRQLQQELGLTVLFSAHELNPLLRVMDQVLYLGGGHAALGTAADIITGPVLSRLYGSPIDVIRAGGRVFILSGEHEVDRDDHRQHHHA